MIESMVVPVIIMLVMFYVIEHLMYALAWTLRLIRSAFDV